MSNDLFESDKLLKHAPAYPLRIEEEGILYPGLTMRDWFAGMALFSVNVNGMTDAETAKYAYELADAMMKVKDGQK